MIVERQSLTNSQLDSLKELLIKAFQEFLSKQLIFNVYSFINFNIFESTFDPAFITVFLTFNLIDNEIRQYKLQFNINKDGHINFIYIENIFKYEDFQIYEKKRLTREFLEILNYKQIRSDILKIMNEGK